MASCGWESQVGTAMDSGNLGTYTSPNNIFIIANDPILSNTMQIFKNDGNSVSI